MDKKDTITQMVRLMDEPAFCVLEGTIIAANQAAVNHMVPVGDPVCAIMEDGKAEYSAFDGQQLSLTVQIQGARYRATVFAVEQYHIFKLESAAPDPELRALALAAQQLRVPLSNILLTTGRLFPKLDTPSGSPETEQLAQINRALSVMQRMLGNMSDTARFAQEPPRLEMQDVDALLWEIFEQVQALCEFAGVQLEYKGLSAPVYTMIDSIRLERAIYNMVSNAMKAGAGTIQVTLTKQGGTLYLTMQDNGRGTDLSGDIFERYRREPSVFDGGAGLGMGMQLIWLCADAHKGTVLLDSSKKGFRLTMSLPIRLEGESLRSPRVDYSGERDHALIELSETLPASLYKPTNKH